MMHRTRRLLAACILGLTLLVTACAPAAPPSRFDQVQQDTSGKKAPAAVAKAAEQGASFNKFFPKSVAGYQIVAAQEKKGFAEYKVNQDGKNVAMLSVNDTISNPAAAEKYKSSSKQIEGFPSVEIGSTGTGLLVSGRYQVKVQSRDTTFTKDDRAAWLGKFNLKGLAQLKE
jgi:hypothetical protein